MNRKCFGDRFTAGDIDYYRCLYDGQILDDEGVDGTVCAACNRIIYGNDVKAVPITAVVSLVVIGDKVVTLPHGKRDMGYACRACGQRSTRLVGQSIQDVRCETCTKYEAQVSHIPPEILLRLGQLAIKREEQARQAAADRRMGDEVVTLPHRVRKTTRRWVR